MKPRSAKRKEVPGRPDAVREFLDAAEPQKPPDVPELRKAVLSALEVAINDSDVEQLWHWNAAPMVVLGQALKPGDIDLNGKEPDWSNIGTLAGYWLAPGERRPNQKMEFFRSLIESLPEIHGKITATPIQCAICIDGEDRPFVGEVWTIAFPDIPIIKSNLSMDHPLTGLNDRFMGKGDSSTLGILANQRAMELRSREDGGDLTTEILNTMYAEQAEAESERLLDIGDRRMVEGAGEKLVPVTDAGFSLADTLRHPNMISVSAANERLQLARNADVLQLALDASMTAGANNSLEKMLCHQLAALHRGAMKMMKQGLTVGTPNVDAMRTMGTAARMMTTFQAGMETLQKVKNKGKQTVVVKHVQMVQVQDGGQAVVAGKVKGEGGGNGRGGRK